jgi:hypothetical protein
MSDVPLLLAYGEVFVDLTVVRGPGLVKSGLN